MESLAETTRIGDSERDRVRAQLQRHAADGRLTLDELSDRLGELYAARTAADLEHSLRDLPALPAAPPRFSDIRRLGAARIPKAVATAALLLAIWAVVGVTMGSWYFWPVWPLAFIGFGALREARGGRPWCASSGSGRRAPRPVADYPSRP